MQKADSTNEHHETTKYNEQRLLALAKATSDAIYRISADWRTMSELDGRVFLADTDEADSSWMDKHIIIDDKEYITGIINECIKDKKTFELEHRIAKADGSVGWMYSRAVPIFDEAGNITEWIGATNDITKRKRAEEEALELIDSFAEGSWIVDRLAGTIKCSEKWSKRIGLDQIPENERLLYTHTLTHPDDTKNGNSIEHCIEIGITRFDLEYRVETVDSGYIWTQNKGKIVYDAQGSAIKVYAATIDITERKKIEQVLRYRTDELEEKEKEYLEIIDSSTEGSFIHDLIKDEIYFSSEWKNKLNVSHLSPSQTAKMFVSLAHPDDVEGMKKAYDEACKYHLSKVRIEFRVRTKAGYIWVLGQAKIRYDTEGKAVKYYGTHMDITERKRAEEAKERLIALMDHNPSLIFLKDEEGRYVYLNKAYEKNFIPSGDWYGKTDFDFWPKESAELFRANDAHVLNSEQTIQFMENSTDMEGKRFCWLNYKFPFTDSKNRKYVGGIGIDATRLILAEEALKESETKYRELVEYSPAGIYEVDFRTRRFTSVNDSICMITGYSREELLNMPAFDILDMESGEKFQQRIDQWMSGKEPDDTVDYKIITKDGKELYIHLDVKFTRDEKGNLLGASVIGYDITERKKMEEALRDRSRELEKANRQKEDILESISDCFYALNNDLLFTYVNRAAEEIWGIARADLLGRSIEDVFPGIIDISLKKFHLALEEQSPQHYEVFSKVALKWGDMSVYPTKDGISVYFHDITERKRMEEELFFQAHILSSMQDAICAVDENFHITYWNGVAEKMFGWTAREAIGSPSKDIFRTVSPSNREESIANLIKNNGYTGEAVYKKKDEEEIYTNVVCSVIRNTQGEYKGNVSTFIDITERKETEKEKEKIFAEVSDERERLETIINSIDDEVWISDAKGNLIQLNPTAQMVHGLKADGKPISGVVDSLEILESDGTSRLWENTPMLRALKGETVSGEEYIRHLNTGELRYRRYNCAPIMDRFGNITGTVAIAKDITERKKAEEAVRKSEARALELIVQLEEADKNKNKFLSALSHELRNPLAVISAGLEIQGISQNLEHIKKANNIINRQMNQLCSLVDDLLDLTRISNNKIELKKEQLELNSLAITIAEDQQALFDEKKIELYARTSADPIYIEADPVRIKQIVGNLLHNAQKYTQTGGETLLTIYKENKNAVISVKDNGIGLSSEIILRLFQPFVQADMSLDRRSGGLGLGLSITKGIVELHGGNVSAYSKGLGKGSEFVIRLPLIEIMSHTMSDKTEQTDICIPSLKILVIEDNNDFADLLSTMLTTIGYQVEVSSEGIDGLKKARRFLPDIIICDIGLPGINGYDIAATIKKDDNLMDIYLIALTGYAGGADLLRAKYSGFDRHLAKPVSLASMQQIIKEYVNERGKEI